MARMFFNPDPGGSSMTWPQAPNVQLARLCSTTATSGDNTLAAAPGSGVQHIITSIILQLEAATATTLILKAGSTAVLRIHCQNQGDGCALVFPAGQGLALGSNAAMVLNLSGANSCGYSIQYYTDVI